MKVSQLKLCYGYHKSRLLKTIVLLKIVLFGWLPLIAQEAPNLQLKIETGLLMTSENSERLGLFFRVEPKLKIFKNTFIGLRIGISVNEQEIEDFDPAQFNFYDNINDSPIQFINPDNGLLSMVPTLDYYFMEPKFRPYLGVGVGYYFLTTYNRFSQSGTANPSEDLLEVSVNNQIGWLLRGGLNFGKLIVGLEFNYIARAEMQIPNGQIIGTVDNRYIGLSFGYAIGIGRSSK